MKQPRWIIFGRMSDRTTALRMQRARASRGVGAGDGSRSPRDFAVGAALLLALLTMSPQRAVADDNPATAPAVDPAVQSRIAVLSARLLSLRGSQQDFQELVQLGEPAQPAVFQVLLKQHLANSTRVAYTVSEWNRRHMVVSDAFRPDALKLVPSIVQQHRTESVQILALYGPVPELEPDYVQLSLSMVDPEARQLAVQQILLIDPAATRAAEAYSLAYQNAKSTNDRYAILSCLSMLGPAADPQLLELTRSSNIDDRMSALAALGHYPVTKLRSNNPNQPDGHTQPVSQPVLDRSAQLLQDPVEGIVTQGNDRADRYGGQVVSRVMDLLDTYGRAGRAVAIEALAGPNAAPIEYRLTILRSLMDAFPQFKPFFQRERNFKDSQWEAVQTLARALNQDTPDRGFGKPIMYGQGHRTGINTPVPGIDAARPQGDAGDHMITAAIKLLQQGDAGQQDIAAEVLANAGKLSASQLDQLMEALKTAPPTIRDKLSQGVLSNADFKQSTQASGFAESTLAGPRTPAQTQAVQSMVTSPQGRTFLINRIGAEPPLDPSVAGDIVTAMANQMRIGPHAKVSQSPIWAEPAYRKAITEIFSELENNPGHPSEKAVRMLASADAATRKAAASFLAGQYLSSYYGPDTSTRVADELNQGTALFGAGPSVQFAAAPDEDTADSSSSLWLITECAGGCAGVLLILLVMLALRRTRAGDVFPSGASAAGY